MRLVTFASEEEPHVGAITARGIVDLRVAAPALPQTLLELLYTGPLALRTIQAAIARALDDGVGLLPARAPGEHVRLLAPLPRPGKIFGIGLNYRDHAAETGKATPEVPIVFSKAV